MVIDLAFPKGNFTVFGFLLCSIGFVWAIGILRPFLILLFLLFKAAFVSKPPRVDLLDLVRIVISLIDAPYVPDRLARTTGAWEKRGPIFAMLAQTVVDGKITTWDCWPIDPVLEDAARYRTL
ncbi:MAG TPA: hypothetical protein VF573_23635 [Paraburkholderia sp.]|uniref:hypothetical protein n=1 Tax=Paraburkholderia sp. TaxID=1926495 RepID=UPI002ED4A138